MVKKVLLVISGVLILVAGCGFAVLGQLQPVGNASQVVVLDIVEGSSLSDVAERLHRQELIKSDWAFVWLGRLSGSDRKVIPGEYEFHGGMDPSLILEKIIRGEVIQYAVTIPEGFSVSRIADLLHEKRLADREEFLQCTRDPVFIETLSLSVDNRVDNLEGYLFPDTYQFARHVAPDRLIATMVARFKQTVTEEDRRRAAELGLSMHQAVTLASVIEKETAKPDERTLISGVFHNRLRKNIPLQSDPTVIYALNGFDGNLRKKDLSIDSPYNTYRVVGLPPGPIANPGSAAFRAALYPEPSQYLYFVSRNDGSHEFSATLAEHNRAVRKYQLRERRRTS
ncbi:MAG: endolytic transglycosylase MltG [Nitrospira sp. SB0677_bin_15]|nr:endolytic transglycosylase MltG [Nitrospira sp. SB0661_bin_20]MYG40392.1 endolytic transglycosylase MltG [Nitrospira sp. SB0677_bin_15]MYH03157.1 endolytic transglycosylase MltG [Nitrospira sp. SB0675_bin_23]MYJ23924.1 endolytic transglycosylase MltG [Nitrospira sp. SB0673_bin_12]